MLNCVGCDLPGAGEQLGIAGGAVRLGEAVKGPGLGARPRRIRRESLVRMREDHLARRGVIRETDNTSAGCELLAIVARIVVYALDSAAVRAHQPLGALERVL